MRTHYDLRLRNKSVFKVNEQMSSMKSRAKKVADAYSFVAWISSLINLNNDLNNLNIQSKNYK